MRRDYVEIGFLAEHDEKQNVLRKRVEEALKDPDSTLRKALAELGCIPENLGHFSTVGSVSNLFRWASEELDDRRAKKVKASP